MINRILNLVFPVDCALCGVRVDHWRTGAMCGGCEGHLVRLQAPYCERCGFPAPVIEGACGQCLKGETQYDFGRAALELNEELRELVHHFKYNDRVSLARPLGRALRACLDGGGFKADFAVPVPLHRRRERQRGYNQAELLASQLDMPCDRRIVQRRVDTESQTGLSRNQRALNVRSAFECRGAVDGAVLIVDDVQTTGATINEVARVLKRNGAGRIEVLTLARVGVSNQELATRTAAGS